MHKLLLTTVFLGFAATASQAQTARVKQYTAQKAGTVVLKDAEDKYGAQVYNMEMPEPDAGSDKARLRDAKKQVGKMYPPKVTGSAFNKTTAANTPYVVKGFVADSLPGVPPDNDMAKNNDSMAISVINSYISVLNSNTGDRLLRKSLFSFSSSTGFIGIGYHRYDPKVIYDPVADKFICVLLIGTGPQNNIAVAFSETNDPTGQWNVYSFPGNYNNDTTWFDYPAIAITQDELFLTGNKIKHFQSWQSGFSETVIYQIDKASGYSGNANLTYQIWDSIAYNGPFIRNLFPVKGGSGIYGPDMYFLSNRNFDVQNDTVFLLRIPGKIGSTNNQIDLKILESPIDYGVPPNGRQKDTFELATNDGRVLGAYMENGQIEFVSTSVNPVNGAACVYKGNIKNPASAAPALTAEFYSIDTLDFGYPNLSFTGWDGINNHSLISFNYTGPNTFAGMGAVMHDGTSFSDLVKVKEGDSTIKVLNAKEQRWGDYMGNQMVYNQTGNVWIEGIYGRKDQEYGNWMAELSIYPVKASDNKKQVSNAVVYPNPAINFISMDFTLQEKGVYSFAIYDVQGRLVDNILSQQCKQGKNRIAFNVASLPAGNYIMKAISDDGKEVWANTFVRQ